MESQGQKVIKGLDETMKRDEEGSAHRVLSFGAHQPRLQYIQRLTQECGAASLRTNAS